MEQDGRYTLETPESVEVHFELAGPGSRFCAMAVDLLLIWLLMFVLVIMLALTGAGVVTVLEEAGPTGEGIEGWLTWVNAIVVVVITCIFFGYHAFFELIMRGQTPGKRALKIRAIRDDGTPMTATDIAIRNLMRIVDFLPFFYALGGAVAFWSRMHKRLGDIAAGTIVVKEAELDYRARADKKYELPAAPVVAANLELTPEERRVIQGFLQRRVELLPEARRQLAERLAGPLFAKYGGQFGHAESYLERLVQGKHYEP